MDGLQTDDLSPLFLLGDPGHDWPDYRAELGVHDEHIPALIHLACDGRLLANDTNDGWAPVHAWRALGQLRAEAAIAPLLDLMSVLDEDIADIELPIVLGMIGAAAMPHLAHVVGDRTKSSIVVANALTALQQIATRHPGERAACVRIIERPLSPLADPDREVAGFAVASLMDLRSVESIEIIRDAYRRGAVDVSIPGDEEDAEIALGVRTVRLTPPPRYDHCPEPDRPPAPIGPDQTGREPCPCGSGRMFKACCLH